VIHIGQIIRKEVESKRLTYKEFGALIHRNEKTIPDIYERDSMSTDLLLTICGALNKDFLSVYYSEEPLKSLRNDDVAGLHKEAQLYHEQIQKLSYENDQLKLELALTKELNEAQKVIILFANDKINSLKST
jgi:hypothetical protein